MAKTLTPVQIANQARNEASRHKFDVAAEFGSDSPEYREAEAEADRLFAEYKTIKAADKAERVAKATREFHLRNWMPSEDDRH